MRLSLLTVSLLACIVTLVAAWSKEDQEIFRLRQEVELSEGPGTSFYDFLEIKPSATQDEINKAYRKKSRVLHPDKVKRQFAAEKGTGKDKKGKKGGNVSKLPSNSEIKSATKAASDRFARLGIVTEILRGAGRERYDHFLNNGFPTWKGTGYYYARFRPGLGSVLVGLFIFVGGGGHWLALYLSWQREQKFIERLIAEGRRGWRDNIPGLDAALSGSGTATPVPAAEESEGQPIPRNRRERRMADKMEAKDSKKDNKKDGKKPKATKASPVPTPPAGGGKRRVKASNNRSLVVDAVGNVYVEQEEEDGIHEILLDPNHFPQPTFKSTALYRLPVWTINTVISRFSTTSSQTSTSDNLDDDNSGNIESESEEMEEEGATESTSEDFEVIKRERAKTSAVNGTGKAVKRGKKGRR